MVEAGGRLRRAIGVLKKEEKGRLGFVFFFFLLLLFTSDEFQTWRRDLAMIAGFDYVLKSATSNS